MNATKDTCQATCPDNNDQASRNGLDNSQTSCKCLDISQATSGNLGQTPGLDISQAINTGLDISQAHLQQCLDLAQAHDLVLGQVTYTIYIVFSLSKIPPMVQL